MNVPVLFQAPHRVMFLAGAVQVLAALAWWAYELALRLGPGAATDWPLYAGWLHGVWLIYGVYPFFIVGFLMTAMPRWQGAAPVALHVYLAAWGLGVLGWLLFWAGLRWHLLLPAAFALLLVGWLVVWRELLRIAEQAHPDRRSPRLLGAAFLVGALGLGMVLVRVLGAGDAWLRGALELGLWGFLAPVFLIVSHRMIPFFSAAVLPDYQSYRPYPLLYLLLACLLAHGLLVLAGLGLWTWSVDLPGAAMVFHLSARWRLRASFVVPLLGMLHAAFLWLGIALALYALQSAARLAGHELLGLAPLHAMSIGFFSSMLLGMASRVTLGHAGRDLAADRLTLAVFVGLQVITLLRIAADLLPVAAAGTLLLLAALGWLTGFGAWFLRYAPAYWRPRVDGRPG